MKKAMDSHSERVLKLTLQAMGAFIDEALAAHKDGGELREMHDRGETRWRLGYDEATGLITLGALMPTGEVVPVGAAIIKPAADVPVRASTTLN